MVPKVSLQVFLSILGAQRPKITSRSFWPACGQMVLLTGMWLKPGFSPFDHGSNFQNFDLESLRTFTPMVPKVSLLDFLPILGTPWPKITNSSFWPSCDQMVVLASVQPKPGFGPFKDHLLNFQNFDLENLWTFTPMVPKVFLLDFLPILGTPWPKIMNSSFWPSCDQMILLTSVRPKSIFDLCDHCATRTGLRNPRLIVG